MQLLSYISTSRISLVNRDFYIQRLLSTSKRQNKALNVTGVLFLDQDFIFQTIEGPHDAVRTLFQSVKADPRHHNVKIIVDEPVEERRFPNWAMEGFYDPNPLPKTGGILRRIEQRAIECHSFDASKLACFVWRMVSDMAEYRVPFSNTAEIPYAKRSYGLS